MCEEVEIVVNSVVVPESIRMNKLPEYFGGKFLICENLIYHYMEKLCSDYQGGYWNFYELSNGGFFMAPSLDAESLNLIWANNYFDGSLSLEAAGIVACLFSYNHMSSIGGGDQFINLYHWLLEYSWSHPEGGVIAKAID
ncbi:antirestriction protein [sulfur-oxidizing endosymbiont of Gigantopelta aegis]|uniref:antirestriction protein n=1 Tax=sulfur-oxidizing endosymbiont of Gigantopelta aegis TaxID=2794934 RepID=UPI0018DBE822|nr:antirestriction protein [sulfur-oxidizing endosymbiont of Gigantopelta aegis]